MHHCAVYHQQSAALSSAVIYELLTSLLRINRSVFLFCCHQSQAQLSPWRMYVHLTSKVQTVVPTPKQARIQDFAQGRATAEKGPEVS